MSMMNPRPAALLSVAALALAACGNDEEQAPEAQQPPGGGQPPAAQTQPQAEQGQPPAEPAGEELTTEELFRESEAVAETVADAARRLVEDPNADVSEDLARVEERARGLLQQAQQPLQEGREQAEGAVQEGRQQLSAEQRREARQRLAELNQRTLQSAQRLRRVVDPEAAARVAREEADQLRAALDETLDALRDAVPPDVRERADQLRDRLGELAP